MSDTKSAAPDMVSQTVSIDLNVTTSPGIRFLTFNTWGLKYVSKFRKQRLNEIANKLANDEKHHYDVVALQEVWCKEDWDYMEKKLKHMYPFRRYFSSGIISGPGLAILSKIPIESTFLYRFPINGRPSAFFRGDWFVGKSISVTLLRTSELNSVPIAVLNSHMHAPYSATGDAAYDCHRACQAWDFARIAKMLAKAGYAVIVVGDLNSKPDSLPYRILTKESTIFDSWEVLMQNSAGEILSNEAISQLEPKLQLTKGATTCDSTLNTWRAYLPNDKAKRLDYVLINPLLEPSDASVRFTEQIPNVGSFSDHFAYYCRLHVTSKSSNDTVKNFALTTGQTAGQEVSNLYERIRNIKELIILIEEYQKTSTLGWQLKWRAAHVLVSIILIIGLHVMVGFTSAFAGWSSVLVLFGSTLITLAALTNAYIVLLFLPKEYRALEEVKLEALDAQYSLEKHLEELLSSET